MTIYVKGYTGKADTNLRCWIYSLSGAAAGLTYLYTEDYAKLKSSINNVLATLFGMTCDGAKRSCIESKCGDTDGDESLLLSMRNVNIPCGNGFAARDVEETIKRLEILTSSPETLTKKSSTLSGIVEKFKKLEE